MTLNLSISLEDSGNIINYLDRIILTAHENAVSDIHLEPMLNCYRLRYRQNGTMHHIVDLAINLALRCTTRLKVMAQLDISEKRFPQDGRFHVQLPDKSLLDIRLSICPMLWGEKSVLRLLYAHAIPQQISSLGMTTQQQLTIISALQKTQGLILITGPTGSGKTTTLYAMLQQLNHQTTNITTIEDPIEINLDGINQLQLNDKIGLNFTTALRAILRQDPDIIMLGEIRDQLTATIALQAAQTGHLVLATLHTKDSISSIARLEYLGCSGYQIANALSLVIAQRLVKVPCLACNTNCDRQKCCCSEQHSKRIGIFECLPISVALQEQIIQQATPAKILAIAKQEQFISLAEAGKLAVNAGIISWRELNRVIT